MGARVTGWLSPRRDRSLLAGVAAFGLAAALLAGSAFPQIPPNPRYAQMVAAAEVMRAASQILYAEKAARGLLPPAGADPNKTGMIGFEYTPMTTEIGELPSKRTTTNPDFAAALVRLVDTLHLPAGAPVVLVLSGSFPGGDVAMIAALEALNLKPVLLVSAGTSQWGANNPEFNILDILTLLRDRGLIHTGVTATAIGGPDGAGAGMDDPTRAALRASAARHGIPLVEAPTLAAVVDGLVARARTALAGTNAGAVINVGGAVVGPGTCNESFTFPSGVTTVPLPCSGGGTPGVLMRFLSPDVPAVHILNIMRLAAQMDLPFDPIPLPKPGENLALYGPAPVPSAPR
jgi:poly-gamma-glutamate system protein